MSGGIKPDTSELKIEFNLMIVNLKAKIETKFENINSRLNVIENNMKSNTNSQINESMVNIKDSLIDNYSKEDIENDIKKWNIETKH